MQTSMTPLILKLGGSLAQSDRLQPVIALIALSQRPVIVVPGGGPFADAVRTIQPQLAIPEPTAHLMALLAMEQMGLHMVNFHPRLTAARTVPDFAKAFMANKIPVWLPYVLQHDDNSLPTDWTVTSDALAARLAERLEASVALIKACPVPPGAGLDRLTDLGIVDPVFAPTVRRTNLTWGVYGTGDEPLLAKRLLIPPGS